MSRLQWAALCGASLSLVSLLSGRNCCMSDETPKDKAPAAAEANKSGEAKKLETATFGAGCFWCTEAVFQQLKGVEKVVSGYTGGKVPNPTYRQVSSGLTGHAEAIQITYDPSVITFAELLEVFWKTHDPTTLNAQGPDHGPQYRSGVFYHSEEQKTEAEHYKKKLNEAHAFSKPIVTEITAFSKFYPAEDYHQNYYNLNGRQMYCQRIIRPKVDKVKKVFKEKLKTTEPKGE